MGKKFLILVLGLVVLVVLLFFALKHRGQTMETAPTGGEETAKSVEASEVEEGVGGMTEEKEVQLDYSYLFPPDDEKGQALKSYIEKDGALLEFAEMDRFVESNIGALKDILQLPDHEVRELAAVFNRHLKSQKLVELYISLLTDEMSTEEIRELTRISENPLMRNYREAEAKARSEEGQLDLAEFFSNSEKNHQVSKDIMKSVKELSKVMHTSEHAIAMMGKIGDFFPGINEKSEPTKPSSVDLEAKAMRQDLDDIARKDVQLGAEMKLYYELKGKAPEDVDKLTALFNMPVKQKEIALRNRAFEQLYGNDEFIEELTNAISY